MLTKPTAARKHLFTSALNLPNELNFVYRIQSRLSPGALQNPRAWISEHYKAFDGSAEAGSNQEQNKNFMPNVW